jgi:hypothetical protein
LRLAYFLLREWVVVMRACFLGQSICALGYGVATLQSPPLVMDTPASDTPEQHPALPPSPSSPPFPGFAQHLDPPGDFTRLRRQ